MKITAEMTAELQYLTGAPRLHCLYALQLTDGDMAKAANRLRLQHRAPFTVVQEVAIRCIVMDELTKFATTLEEANVRKD